MKTLPEQLESLGGALEAHTGRAPKQAAASAAALAKVGTHPDLQALFTWGLAPAVFAIGELGFDDEQRWLTAAQAAAEHKELRRAPEFPPTLVPFSTDEAGNFTCLDTATGRVMDWDHETRAKRLLSKSLAAYLDPRRTLAAKALRDRARQAKETAKPVVTASAGAVAQGLRRVAQADLNRFDAKGYGGGAEWAAMSSDGRFFAVGFGGSTLLWDAQAGKVVEHAARSLRSELLAFDPTGKTLLRGRWESLDLIDAATGATTHRWDPQTMRPRQAGFTPDGTLVYCLSEERLDVWPVAKLPKAGTAKPKKLAPAASLPAKKGGSWGGVSVADDGRMLVVDATLYAGGLTLWDPRTGTVLGATSKKLDRIGPGVALSPDGTVGVADLAGALGFFTLGKVITLTRQVNAAHGAHGVTALAFDRTGQRLLSSGSAKVKLWDAAQGKALAEMPAPSKNNAPRVTLRSVTTTHALTSEPLALFELKLK